MTSVPRYTLSCKLALLTAVLALNASLSARAALLVASELNFHDNSFLTQPANADTRERMNTFFASYSLLSIEFQGTTQLFQLTNNPDDRYLIFGDLTLYSCDGSVLQAIDTCDGSVFPADKVLEMSLASTMNSYIWMSGTFTDSSLHGDPLFGVAATTGNPFPGGTDLMGWFDTANIEVDQVRSDLVLPPDPTLEVTVRPPEIRDYYFFGMVDYVLEHRTNSDDPPIPQGQSRDFLDPLEHPSPSYFTCVFCDVVTVGVGFSSPGRGGHEDYGSTRTHFSGQFTFEEGSPTPIPAPATVWLLLGGLGALGLVGWRQRVGTG